MVTQGDLLDKDPDDLERCLVRHGRLDRAPDAARRRTLVGVGGAAAASAGLAMTSISSGAAAAPGAVPWLLAMKWMAVGVASGAVTLGVAGTLRHRSTSRLQEAPTIAATSAVTAASRVSQANAIGAKGAQEATDSTSDTPEGPATPAMVVPRAGEAPKGAAEIQPRAQAPAAVAPAITNEQGSLEHELRFLEDARLALDTRAPARALTALDRYAEKFPQGRMGIEASALRIETLFLLGRRDEAQALARSFLASYPRSPAAIRVRRLVEDAAKGDSHANP